jgi:hypothetical protein
MSAGDASGPAELILIPGERCRQDSGGRIVLIPHFN